MKKGIERIPICETDKIHGTLTVERRGSGEYRGDLTLGGGAVGDERLHARSKVELIKKAIRRVEKANKE